MSITIKGKTYRNLQEQVEKNKDDIEEIIKGGGKPIQPGSVTTDKLADSSVTTDKIVNGAVTGEKIANHTVGLEQLTEGILNSFLLTTRQYGDYVKAHIEYTTIDDKPCIRLYFEGGWSIEIYENDVAIYNYDTQQGIVATNLLNLYSWYDSIKEDLYYDDDEGKIKITDIYRLVADYITVDNANLGYANISNDLDVEGNTSLHDTAYIKEIAKETGEESIILDDKMEYDSFNRLNVTQFLVMAGEANDDYYPVAGLLTTPNNRNIANDLLLFANLDFDLDITDPTWLATLKAQCKLFYDYLSSQESYGYDGANREISGQIDSKGKGKLTSKWSKGGDDYSFSMYCYRHDPYLQPDKYELHIDLSNDTSSTTHFYCSYDPDTDTIDSATFVNDGTYPGITVFPIYGIKNAK